MAVVVETTLGDITVDLFLKERPKACQNFLKLCKLKYYNYNLFHTVSRGFIAQTGDPTGSRNGGESIFGVLDGPLKRFFLAETNPRIKHTVMGLVSFVGNEENMIGSQFFFTLGEELSYLDEKHCVFGQVTEGLDVLEVINEAICDSDDRPYQDIRITHTVVLDDPLPDLPRMIIPSRSPSPSAERLQGGRIAPDEEIDETAGKTLEEINEMAAEREAKARATILEMVGDIPDADVAPPENVLFVCKLNPVTTEDDLEIIFSRFGKIKSCEVIKDHKTGDSLQYAFVEFEEQKSCEDAYFKMDNVLIDDRRIHVDFSQSVSKVKWMGKGRGVKHFNEKDNDIKAVSHRNKRNKSRSRSLEKKKGNRNDRRQNNRSYERNYSRRDHDSRRYENERNRSYSSRNNYDGKMDYRDRNSKRDTRRNDEQSRERYRRNRSNYSSSTETKRHDARHENSSKHQEIGSKKRNNRDASSSSSDSSTENKKINKKSSRDRYKNKGGENGSQKSKRSRSRDKKVSRKTRSSSSSDKEDRKRDKSDTPESPRKSKTKKRKGKSRSSSDSSDEPREKAGKSRKVEKSRKKSKRRSSTSDSSIDRKLDKDKSRHRKRN